ncbi:MBL fold metallo-hydrolase [Aquimarina spongiae]|uniref:L-ascorbate metabolism protein UlaG, beta-lactamase superfamily n=1 Tax=Aquimarina spongiae TaxID=570521 RepID=A0A1M6A486_9FLAO|nr:MBL fold metallo-hydrolase [Aquimarina spongiae]SHI30963.1 L-ascorbate metabolism protein UlaG, beta-lactamase superfamily [Aquimarina spongiae]
MKIHHIRNATLVIEIEDKVILVDPMLGQKGETGPPFTFFRFKPQRNPTIDLPTAAIELISKTTHCLLTHLHPDHLDKKAEHFLRSKNIPIICSVKDVSALEKKDLNISQEINYWERVDFLGGKIEGIPARHGYGFIAKPAGNVMGFYMQFPNQPSIYISSDTIYTNNVKKVLTEYEPDINVLATGSAQFDIFKPLLMTMEDILQFIKDAPGHVIANHMESVNHCPTTRAQLKKEVANIGLSEKVFIPNDGECMIF